MFLLKLADTRDFEERVRGVEAELGIKPGHGISITYEREK